MGVQKFFLIFLLGWTTAVLNVDCSLAKEHWRNYHQEVNDEEKEFITYIVFTLGHKSLTKIYQEQEGLKKAGDHIDHLHPLKFLSVIFTDEDLKAAIINIKESRWVWGQFKKGLYKSLKEETKNKNMSPEIIANFANVVNVDSELILSPVLKQDWDGLIVTLIKNVKREGNPGRYDM